MSNKKLQKTLNYLVKAGKIKKVYKNIDGRQTTWFALPKDEYLLNGDEERALLAIERLTKILYRPPTVEELAVEMSVTPQEAEKLAYKETTKSGWFNPTPELITCTREKLGEVLVCAARIKQNLFSEGDLKEIYHQDPEVIGEAKRFLAEHSKLIPSLVSNSSYHQLSWTLSWPNEALKYLKTPYQPKPRSIPGSIGIAFPHKKR